MPKFKKKPVIIEAVQWNGTHDGIVKIVSQFQDIEITEMGEDMFGDELPTFTIKTLEGKHSASSGDWIIRGVKGEYYPCKPDIFDMTYEPA